MRSGFSHRAVVAVVVAVAAVGLGGCSKDEFPDRSAVVEVGDRTIRFEIASCGLDGTTAFIAARSDGGAVLQAVVGVDETDHETGIPSYSGITISDGDTEQGAFGAGAWEVRGKSGEPPGTVTTARIGGARIQATGRVVLLDEIGNPTGTDDDGVDFSLDARCDEV